MYQLEYRCKDRDFQSAMLMYVFITCSPQPSREMSQRYSYSTIMFSLSDSVAEATEALLSFLGGFSFFSGLPSLIDSDLSALRVRFRADPSSTGDDVDV